MPRIRTLNTKKADCRATLMKHWSVCSAFVLVRLLKDGMTLLPS